MALILYVADGPRDHATLPRLVANVLGRGHESDFFSWRQIRLHRGYDRKLEYAVRAAKARGHDALVAVVDNDGEAARLPTLIAQREASRSLAVPTAVGEAHPHVEAWLVDDLEALRSVLDLDPQAKAPPGKNPKAELDALIDAAGRAADRMAALSDLADAVRIDRCRNAAVTGLSAFANELKAELAPHLAE